MPSARTSPRRTGAGLVLAVASALSAAPTAGATATAAARAAPAPHSATAAAPAAPRTPTAAVVPTAAAPASAAAPPLDGGGPARIGDPRPALEVATLDGDLVNAGRVGGRVLIVDFFATWCGPCHQALVDLLAARATAAPDVLLVLVDLQESPEVVRAWAARAHLPADAIVALDPIGATFRRWGARKLPTTFIVDGAGVVRHINRGWGPGYRARFDQWLRGLVRTGPANPRAP